MARTKSMEVLEQKIEKAQEDVVKARKAYDSATAALKALLDKKEALQKEKIMDAITKSSKSLDEILKFITGESVAEGN